MAGQGGQTYLDRISSIGLGPVGAKTKGNRRNVKKSEVHPREGEQAKVDKKFNPLGLRKRSRKILHQKLKQSTDWRGKLTPEIERSLGEVLAKAPGLKQQETT